MAQTTLEGFEWEFEDMEANTMKKFETVKDKVRKVMEKYPSSKGDDLILIYRYYQMFEPDRITIKFKEFKKLLMATAPESITRARRKIQETGELKPTERVVRKRRRREEIFRDGMKQ